ncbi:ATP-binding protein [Geitlerinema splendidum]|jgi:heavy metal sensor kinase|nr:ATP-binding protein [Geitlerinema splendidum]
MMNTKINTSARYAAPGINWWMRLSPKSLRSRLALLAASLLTIIQIGLSVAFYQFTLQGLITQLDNNLITVATQVNAMLDNGEDFNENDINFQFDDSGIAAQTFLRDRLFFVRVVDTGTGRILAENTDYGVPIHPLSDHAAFETLRAETSPVEAVRVYSQRIDRDGRYALQVGQSLSDIEATQLQLINLVIISAFVTAGLGGGIGWLIAQRALKPIKALTQIARSMDEHDLSTRITTELPNDEIGQLGAVFNQMLDRIEAAFLRQRQFTADAAHELRTPLAIIQTGLDVALEQMRTPEVYHAMLDNLRSEVTRLTKLTTTLLTLARLDTSNFQLSRQVCDVSVLVETVADQMQFAAREKGIDIERNIQEGITAWLDENRIIQLVVNLLDNAIKYTPEGGSITVSLSQQDGTLQLRITDTGIGISAEHLAHIFDRFYRVDRARSRQQGGFGLGLAISQQIAHLHGGQIDASSTIGSGSTFIVTLPTS